MEQLFRLKYDGEGVLRGEMDADDVAEALHGFSGFTKRLGRTLYGEEAELLTTVRGFHQGSFIIEFAYVVAEGAGLVASLSGGSPPFLLNLIAECMSMFKHLNGQPPSSTRKADEGGLYVENNFGKIEVFNIGTVKLVCDPRTGRDVQKFVGTPLTRSAERLSVLAKDEEIVTANRDEISSFVPIEAGEFLTEHTVEVVLQVQTVVLVGHRQWRFNDGQKTFAARVEDEDFFAQVQSGSERFGKGDTLRVRLRATQRRVNGELKAEYVVEKVLEHEKAPQNTQRSMF